jgi:hypothetical protein
MSHSKEINETSIRQLPITHVELKLYSDACSEPTHPLTVNLIEVPLSDHLLYEAISYCWGDPKDKSIVTCNGHTLPVPRNLEVALRNMRYQDKPRVLWADAICIDQSNRAEMASQVQLMRKDSHLAR